jgi:HAMP domain-containing protein
LSDKSSGCLKYTAIGCGSAVVLAIAIPLIAGLFIMRPLNRAIDSRDALEESFGNQSDFVPAASGAVAPDRIEAFIEVRQKLIETCSDFEGVDLEIKKLESFDDQDEVSRTEVLLQAFKTTKSAMSMGPLIGQFFDTRNRALVDAEMGLGEFTYIYVVAYHGRILAPDTDVELLGPRVTNARVREALLSMLENQSDLLRESGAVQDEIEAVEAEIAAMTTDGNRLLWQDGVPAAVAESIAPFRQTLDEFFCPVTAPLEMMKNVKRGPGVETL